MIGFSSTTFVSSNIWWVPCLIGKLLDLLMGLLWGIMGGGDNIWLVKETATADF